MRERVRALRVVGPESTRRDSLASSLDDGEEFTATTVQPADAAGSLDEGDAVIVLDDPPANDGLDTYTDIRASGSNLPVVLVTADIDPERLETALSAGVTEYVAWDGETDTAELAARVRAQIENPRLDGCVEARRWRAIIGSLAHDMKNPLNVVAGRLELLDIDDTHGEAVDRSINRVESLLEEVSAVADATGQSNQTASLDVAAIAERVWADMDTPTATLTTEVDRTVEGDREALQLVLRRLLENAVTHGGDDVTVTVGDAPAGFYVADDGPGIPADDRDRVFEQGYGTTPHGEGYGLFVARRIARANGWEITLAESNAGGARFEIHDR